jgi:hypothetical protein
VIQFYQCIEATSFGGFLLQKLNYFLFVHLSGFEAYDGEAAPWFNVKLEVFMKT